MLQDLLPGLVTTPGPPAWNEGYLGPLLMDAARRDLGYAPKISLRDGLTELVAELRRPSSETANAQSFHRSDFIERLLYVDSAVVERSGQGRFRSVGLVNFVYCDLNARRVHNDGTAHDDPGLYAVQRPTVMRGHTLRPE